MNSLKQPQDGDSIKSLKFLSKTDCLANMVKYLLCGNVGNAKSQIYSIEIPGNFN